MGQRSIKVSQNRNMQAHKTKFVIPNFVTKQLFRDFDMLSGSI